MRSETFSTPEPPEVEVRLASGTIRVEALPQSETIVEVVPQNEAAAEVVDDVRIEQRGSGAVLVDVPDRRGGFGLFRSSPEFDIRITCPERSTLEAKTASADVSARGTYAAVRVRTASGDVEVDRADRSVEVQSASGDIEVVAAGSAELNTTSGDVRIAEVRGPLRASLVSGDFTVTDARASVEASTVSGDQRLDAVQRGVIALRSVSGDVTVGVRRGANVWLDVRSMSGDTDSELDLTGDAPESGQAEVELRINTVSGDVSIRRSSLTVEPAGADEG